MKADIGTCGECARQFGWTVSSSPSLCFRHTEELRAELHAAKERAAVAEAALATAKEAMAEERKEHERTRSERNRYEERCSQYRSGLVTVSHQHGEDFRRQGEEFDEMLAKAREFKVKSAPGDHECSKCGLPVWSDGDCEGCDEPGSTCIVCDQEWCQKCWNGDAHNDVCPPDAREAQCEGSAHQPTTNP